MKKKIYFYIIGIAAILFFLLIGLKLFQKVNKVKTFKLNQNIEKLDYNNTDNYTNHFAYILNETIEEKDKTEIFDSIDESYRKAKEFLNKSIEGILLNNFPFKSSENPKLSVVIPLYNCKKVISRAIKSIQNHNLLDLEIVLVDDFSTDETLSFVQAIQIEDPRIKIIKNQKNMGILYSRSIGAINSKGQYIFPLDSDDMFLDKDVFETVLNIADKGNYDIVEFKGIFGLLGNSNLLINRKIQDIYFSNHKLNLVMFQPELGNYPIFLTNKTSNRKLGFRDVFLWAKCIKTEIYQRALNKLGEERYSRHMMAQEDVLVTFILFNTAKSFKFIGKYGIYHIQTAGSASWGRKNAIKLNIYNLYLTDAVIDFSQKTIVENKKLMVYLINFMLERENLKETLNNIYNKKLFISCIDRILSSNYISDEDKNLIRKNCQKLDFLNYHF